MQYVYRLLLYVCMSMILDSEKLNPQYNQNSVLTMPWPWFAWGAWAWGGPWTPPDPTWLRAWRWFTRPQTVTPLSTNPAMHGRNSNSRPVDHMSDALTTTPPSHRCSYPCKSFFVNIQRVYVVELRLLAAFTSKRPPIQVITLRRVVAVDCSLYATGVVRAWPRLKQGSVISLVNR